MQIWLLKEIGLTLHEGLMPPPRPQARTDPSPLTHKHTYTHARTGFDSVQGAESSLAQLPLPQEVQQSQEASAFRQEAAQQVPRSWERFLVPTLYQPLERSSPTEERRWWTPDCRYGGHSARKY